MVSGENEDSEAEEVVLMCIKEGGEKRGGEGEGGAW